MRAHHGECVFPRGVEAKLPRAAYLDKPIPAKGPMRANPDRSGKINCGDTPTTRPIPTRG